MKLGDRVKCVRSECSMIYSVGDIYVIEGFDVVGDMLLRDNYGDLDSVPIPMDGTVWTFEPVDEEAETQALMNSFNKD